MIFLISIAAFFSTAFGGLFALKFKDKLHLILGFSAGAVIGVAFFDLLPEAISLGAQTYNFSTMTSISALGFIIYMILDRFIILHSHHDENEEEHRLHGRGKLGAGSLSFHSFLDGLAIGLAFQVSSLVGAIVAIAVLVHDFSDGINTVNLVLKNGGSKTQAIKWLAVDALAPILGIIVSTFFHLNESSLGVILAFFAGFFLYIGASDLLPESHHNHPTIWNTVLTVVGIVVIYLAVNLEGI